MQYTFVWAFEAISIEALAFTMPCVFVFLSDSKQNGDANVALSEEEGCSLTQPLSPSEKWSLRCTRGRDKTKKEATCFLLTSGDSNIHTGKLHTYLNIHIYCWQHCTLLHFNCIVVSVHILEKIWFHRYVVRYFVFPPLVLSAKCEDSVFKKILLVQTRFKPNA